MTHRSELDLSCFPDERYSWNDNLTEGMSATEKLRYLHKEAGQFQDRKQEAIELLGQCKKA